MTIHLKTRYIQKRGDVYQFVLRVPADLKDRYGKQFIRFSLKTDNQVEALKKAEPLAKQYLQEFDRLKQDQNLKPREVTMSAKELAQHWGNFADFIEYLVEPTFEKKIGRFLSGIGKGVSHNPMQDYKPEEYLSPVEIEAGNILREGLDVVRLSDAIDLYWKTHKRAGDATFVKEVDRHWGKLVEHLGDVTVMSLSRASARGYVDYLLSMGWKTGTVRRNLKQVNAIVNAAIREAELTKVNPFSNLGIAGEGTDAKEVPVPSKGVLEDIVKTYKDDDSTTSLLALLLVETGARIGEFSGMKVSDVFLDASIPHVKIRPNDWRSLKTSPSIRDVPLVGESLEAMKLVLKMPRDNDALFPRYAKENGNTHASNAVGAKLKKKWGITSHSFRHAMKDRLREAGCPQDIRDAIQGHENGGIAETYGKGHTLQTMSEWLNKVKIQIETTEAST